MSSSPRQFRATAAGILRVGVAISAGALLTGTLIQLSTSPNTSSLVAFQPHSLLQHIAFAIVQFGLVTLIATPVVLVVAAAVFYARRGDRAIAVFAATAGLIILLSFFLGLLVR